MSLSEDLARSGCAFALDAALQMARARRLKLTDAQFNALVRRINTEVREGVFAALAELRRVATTRDRIPLARYLFQRTMRHRGLLVAQEMLPQAEDVLLQ